MHGYGRVSVLLANPSLILYYYREGLNEVNCCRKRRLLQGGEVVSVGPPIGPGNALMCALWEHFHNVRLALGSCDQRKI